MYVHVLVNILNELAHFDTYFERLNWLGYPTVRIELFFWGLKKCALTKFLFLGDLFFLILKNFNKF